MTSRATVILIAAAIASPSMARAQEAKGFALDRFEPSGGGSDWFSLESVDFYGHGHGTLGVWGDWAWKPLVLYDANDKEVASIVDQQLFLHAVGSVTLFERLRLGASLPFVAHQPGMAGGTPGTSFPKPEGSGIGDVRLGIDLRLVGDPGDGFRLALGGFVYIPTGDRKRYTSDGNLRASPHLLAAGDLGPVAWALRAGLQIRPQSGKDAFGDVALGNSIDGGLALGIRPTDGLLIGPEVYGTSSFVDGSLLETRATPLEVLFGVHLVVADDWRLAAGAAPGLNRGIGEPQLRVVARIEYAPAPPREEPRPERPEPPPPPPPPRDEPPPPPPVPDADKDGIPDTEDTCPDVPGKKTGDPLTNGCDDRDGDGIFDPLDACPKDVGPADPDPKKNGCPVARVERGQIRILEQVKFKTGSAVILPESDVILEAVAKVLAEHGEIKKMRVEGHTDNRGTLAYNKRLSTQRAAAVVNWLVVHGTEKSRLTAQGYGPTRPIATNKTEDGRRENRRVEFHIIDPAQPDEAP